MSTIDQKDLVIKTAVFAEPMHNPALRSEEEGRMACRFHGDILINGKPYFLDTSFVFATSDFWTVGDITEINLFCAYTGNGKFNEECEFDEDQKQQVIKHLAKAMTYDTYHWFTKIVSK